MDPGRIQPWSCPLCGTSGTRMHFTFLVIRVCFEGCSQKQHLGGIKEHRVALHQIDMW